MGLGLVIYEKDREIPVFKHGDCEGVIIVHMTLEAGRWVEVNAHIVEKLRQKNEEGEEYSVELSRKDLSVDVKDQDLTKFKEELSETIEAMKNVLYDYQNRMLKGIEFIDSYNF